MVILFLTGSLESDKDGVGDYTRLLALKCMDQNHDCYIIALNDPYILNPMECMESVGNLRILTLRLPATLSWQRRTELVAAFRNRFSIDWISLQFVPYGYHLKGIVKNLARHIGAIVADRPAHVMFHELWIGIGPSAPMKHRMMGKIQRYYVQKLVRNLKPLSITTSNSFYVAMLKTIGLSATELPLFGNMPISKIGCDFRVPQEFVHMDICDESGLRKDRLVGLFFGALYPEWKPEPFMEILISASKSTHKRACLISVGRMGQRGESVWKGIQKNYSDVVDFMTLGEKPAHQISILMQIADFGVAASPWHLIGKSGSAAAMLDHGLPVIVTRDEFQPSSSFSEPDSLLHRCDSTLELKLAEGLPKRAPRQRVEDIAGDFLNKLTK